MNKAIVRKEVEEAVQNRLARKRIVDADRLVTAILGEHSKISGSDKDWYTYCAAAHVRDIMRAVIGKFDPKEKDEIEPDPQLVFAGFERLRIAYPVERDRKRLLIPIELMSETELAEKAEQYRQMGRGCNAHADEIDRYISGRSELQQGAA